MNYCIVENGIIANVIVCENDAEAAKFGAVPFYTGAAIGDSYSLPPTAEDITLDLLAELEERTCMLELLA